MEGAGRGKNGGREGKIGRAGIEGWMEGRKDGGSWKRGKDDWRQGYRRESREGVRREDGGREGWEDGAN